MPIKRTLTQRKREAIREQRKRNAERTKRRKEIEKRKKALEKAHIKKAKKPRLLASNPLVKEIYSLNRRIQASGDNMSDWYEEMYCERPAAPPADLKNAISDENKLVDKAEKKMERLFKKVLKLYGKEQCGALREFIDYPTRYTRGVQFSTMTYKEKQKVHIN